MGGGGVSAGSASSVSAGVSAGVAAGFGRRAGRIRMLPSPAGFPASSGRAVAGCGGKMRSGG